MYQLKQAGQKILELVFNGWRALLKQTQGLSLVAHLILRVPGQEIHGTKLAAAAFGQSEVQEGKPDDENDKTRKHLEQKARELKMVIDDEITTPEAREDAIGELEKLAKLKKALRSGKMSPAEKVVRAVRRAIQRLIDRLKSTRCLDAEAQQALRGFGEHLYHHLWIPSSRYGGSRQARVKTGMAGKFIYERPAGVCWAQ